MAEQLKPRSEVTNTWDLTGFYKTEADYKAVLAETVAAIDNFATTYRGKLSDVATINEALDAFRPIEATLIQLGTYVRLHISSDQTNMENVTRQGEFNIKMAHVNNQMSFFISELLQNEVMRWSSSLKKSPIFCCSLIVGNSNSRFSTAG